MFWTALGKEHVLIFVLLDGGPDSTWWDHKLNNREYPPYFLPDFLRPGDIFMHNRAPPESADYSKCSRRTGHRGDGLATPFS